MPYDFTGLDVFAEKADVANAERVELIDTTMVYADPANVRRSIDEATIRDLADSIDARGQLQAITVGAREADGRYRVILGERRWRACSLLAIPVKAIVSKTNDAVHRAIDQFIENDQREGLSTADVVAFVSAQVDDGRNLSELARLIGRNRTQLSRYQALAGAPAYIAGLFDLISMRSAVALVQADRQDRASTEAFVAANSPEELTVKACEALIRTLSARTTDLPAGDDTEPLKGRPRGTPTEHDEIGAREISLSSEDAAAAPATPSGATLFHHDEASAPENIETGPLRDTRTLRDAGSAGDADSLTPLARAVLRTEAELPQPSGPAPVVEVDGRPATVLEALVRFDDDANPRRVRWS